MKVFLLFIGSVALVYFSGGCRLLDELRNPPKKTPKTVQQPVPKPEPNEPTVLPDGTTCGLNDYEKQYIDAIDQSFKRRQQQNARRVFSVNR